MYQNVNLSFDPAHPLQVAKQGTFERWVETAGTKRRFLVHIPRRCREAAAGIFILPSSGWTADDVLEKTGNGLRKLNLNAVSRFCSFSNHSQANGTQTSRMAAPVETLPMSKRFSVS